MRTTVTVTAILLVVLLASAGGVVAYDGARSVRVAKGISVGGIPIGGLNADAARAKLDRELLAGLQRPVRVHRGTRTWTLTAREAHVQANVAEVVDDALARSDEGGVLKRSVRRLTGESLEADLKPRISYDDRAVVRLLDRVRGAVRRSPKDATFELTAAGPDLTPGRRGLAVDATRLHREIDASIASPTGRRSFGVRTTRLQPKVTTAALAKQNRVVLVANRAANTLRLYEDFKLVKSYGIAAGQPAWPTPTGQFTIANKAVDPTWSVPHSTWAGSQAGKVIPGGSPENPLKARWMGITDGVGIHGTADDGSIGSNASHGCLRMHVPDVIDLYPRVPVGSKILIV